VLATPTAVVAVIGDDVNCGILIKSGEVVELIGKVDVVAFDKAGTLMLGMPVVSDVFPLNSMCVDQILSYAAGAEKFNVHPLRQALVLAGNIHSLGLAEPRVFCALPSQEIFAQIDSH
jgi:cation transport ATPase